MSDDKYWKPIPGYEGLYWASKNGEIKSKKGLLNPFLLIRSYRGVVLSKKGKPERFRLHRLMLMTFVGPPPEGMVCRHLNGNPSDNRLENLKWGTEKENAVDRDIHGKTFRGSQCSFSKIPENKILQIYKSKEGNASLARKFKVNRNTIWNIKNNKTWVKIIRDSLEKERLGLR